MGENFWKKNLSPKPLPNTLETKKKTTGVKIDLTCGAFLKLGGRIFIQNLTAPFLKTLPNFWEGKSPPNGPKTKLPFQKVF